MFLKYVIICSVYLCDYKSSFWLLFTVYVHFCEIFEKMKRLEDDGLPKVHDLHLSILYLSDHFMHFLPFTSYTSLKMHTFHFVDTAHMHWTPTTTILNAMHTLHPIHTAHTWRHMYTHNFPHHTPKPLLYFLTPSHRHWSTPEPSVHSKTR